MSSRHPSISFATAVVIIAVTTISNAGAMPPVYTTATQDLQEISDAIHELTKAVADHRIAETLHSHQTTMSQLLIKSVGTSPQCQTMNYELGVSMGELKAKFTHVSQAVEASVQRVAYLEETIASHSLEVPPDLEDKLHNQSQAVQAAVHQVAHFSQRLQEVETIATQTQEISRDIQNKIQVHVEEEVSCKGSCRSPFYQVGDDCLFVDDTHKASWENARKFCRAFGGDLAVPSDVLKLREFITMFGAKTFWIGGSDLVTEGKWRWINGSEVDLSIGWILGQPDNFGKSEHCLHYLQSHDWLLNDGMCSAPTHFVCQDAMYEL